MSKKAVAFKKPQKKIAETADTWVSQREKNKRLTFDAPISLHADLKIASARTGLNMGEIAITALREYLTKIS